MWWSIGLMAIVMTVIVWCACAGSKTNTDDYEQAKYLKDWYEKHSKN